MYLTANMYKYKRLSETEFLADKPDIEDSRNLSYLWKKSIRKQHLYFWPAQIVLFATSCAIFFSGLKLRHAVPKAKSCHDKDFFPQWSPVLEAVENTGHFHRFDGSFATPNAYKGTPKPSIDKAWDRVLMADGT